MDRISQLLMSKLIKEPWSINKVLQASIKIKVKVKQLKRILKVNKLFNKIKLTIKHLLKLKLKCYLRMKAIISTILEWMKM